MLAAKHIMTTQVVAVTPDDSLRSVIELLADQKISGVPVVDEQKHLLGVISEVSLFDVLFDADLLNAKVSQFMTRNVETVGEDDPIHVLAHLFAFKGIRRLPVVKDRLLVGIVTRRDLLSSCLKGGQSIPSPVMKLTSLVPSIAVETTSSAPDHASSQTFD